MKNPLTILLVEDNPIHIADLKAMLDVELPRLPITVNCLWAANLQEAMSLWDQFAPDAVMTDVFFPTAPGCPEKGENGKFLVERCLLELKAVVWVTSTYHHGVRTEPLDQWGSKRGLEMFDCKLSGDLKDGEAPNKPWRNALYGLFYTFLRLQLGEAAFQNGKLVNKKGYPLGVDNTLIKHEWFNANRQIDPIDEPTMQRMVELGFPRS